MQVFTTTADRAAYLTNPGRSAGEIATDLQTEQGYMLNATKDAWVPLAASRSFDTLADLVATTDDYFEGTFINTRGFYAANDGGGATYIVSTTPLSGYTTDNVVQIQLVNGKYAILYHLGTLVITQFGAKGDGVANDLPAFRKALDFKKASPALNTIYGVAGQTYYLTQQAPVFSVTDQASFEQCCFLYIGWQHSGLTLSGRGAKIIYDNNATQSYVYHVVNGHTNLYRCKSSNIGHEPNNTLYWEEYYWQVMQYDVTPDTSHSYWDNTTQYYGGMDFCNMGTLNNYVAGQETKHITWEDWDISGNDPDALASNEGYWNIFTKMFNSQEGMEDILYKRVKMHHCMSEVVYGGGYAHVQRVNVEECEIYKSHNAISHGGSMRIEGNLLHDLGANGVESFSAIGDKQVYLNNKIYNAVNGITVGGSGTDINVTGSILIQGNQIFNIDTYGIFVAGKIRHANIDSNQVYDCATNISLYALSNNGFPNVSSEVLITNNLIACYQKSNTGIALDSAHGDPNEFTGNIKISGNVFGKTELAQYEGSAARMGSCVDFTGNMYRNVAISDNLIGAGVRFFVTYTATTFAPVMKNNLYTSDDVPEYSLLASSSVTNYSSPATPSFADIRGSFPLLHVTNYATLVNFYKNPASASLPATMDFDGFSIRAGNSERLILLPGPDDTTSRTKILQFYNGRPNKQVYVRYKKIQGNTGIFEYVFSADQEFLPDVIPMNYPAPSGTLAAGASTDVVWYTGTEYLQLSYDSTNGFTWYDQFVFDNSIASNIGLDPNFQVTAVSCRTSIQITVTIKNISGVTQSLDGKTINLKLYPMSNPAFLPLNLQPLRTEGKTNMRPVPVNDDIPNFYLFHDTDTNEYLYWDKRTNTWTTNPFTV